MAGRLQGRAVMARVSQQATVPEIHERRLWATLVRRYEEQGYRFSPTILDELMALRRRLSRDLPRNRASVMQAKLEASIINRPFKTICICGHVHP